MIEVLKILKDASIKIENINESDIPDNLFKKCSYRKNENFIKIFNINFKNYEFEVWGKNKGKENLLNKFNFTKYFSSKIYGDCLILLKNNNYINFDLLIWQKLFEEEITEIESSSEDEDDEAEFNSIELNEESFIYTSEEEEEEEHNK
jgi:hypothetical protein